MNGRILVGTASWSDPGFVSHWYPPKLAAVRRLPWYAEHFNYVEVNSTFYAVPLRSSVEHWAEQTPDGFTFDIKLHKLLSRHSTKPNEIPVDLRGIAGGTEKKVELTPELEQAVAEQILKATAPLKAAGKLGAYLLQLTPSFSPKFHKLAELDRLLDLFKGHKFALELRNRNWMSEETSHSVLDFCERHEIALVMVDAPNSKNFMVMPDFTAVTTPELAYFRLHGRDEKAYTTGKTVGERFHYDYSTEELTSVASRVQTVTKDVQEAHIVFNNNDMNLAPKAAEQFQRILDGV